MILRHSLQAFLSFTLVNIVEKKENNYLSLFFYSFTFLTLSFYFYETGKLLRSSVGSLSFIFLPLIITFNVTITISILSFEKPIPGCFCERVIPFICTIKEPDN